MPQHSIAPWRDETGTIFAADDMMVCAVMGGDGQRFLDDEDNAECLANKHLILAAPDMHALLTTLRYDLHNGRQITQAHINQIDAVLAKAAGQTAWSRGRRVGQEPPQ